MFKYDKRTLGKLARELGFVRDTLEKTLRLTEILKYINENPLLRESLALKGGTAINLTVFDLPRLSVDLDLDYIRNNSREEMLEERRKISENLTKYMAMTEYELSGKSRFSHSLDSYIFSYTNTAGNKDNIKLEINYSLRSHILPLEQRDIKALSLIDPFSVNSLAIIEIFATKIVALLTRAAPRDLYDINNMIYHSIFNDASFPLLKKSSIFYYVLNSEDISLPFDLNNVNVLTEHRIKTDLLPVIRKRGGFDLNTAKRRILTYLSALFELENNEIKFLETFKNGKYHPELLFSDMEILERIKNHPMAIWKLQ